MLATRLLPCFFLIESTIIPTVFRPAVAVRFQFNAETLAGFAISGEMDLIVGRDEAKFKNEDYSSNDTEARHVYGHGVISEEFSDDSYSMQNILTSSRFWLFKTYAWQTAKQCCLLRFKAISLYQEK